MRLSAIFAGCALLLCAGLCTRTASAAFDCVSGQPYATIRDDFEREFDRLLADDRRDKDADGKALDAIIERLDADEHWRRHEKSVFLDALMRSPEFVAQEDIKRDLARRLDVALDAMEHDRGDACVHAQEALTLFQQGLAANEAQWTHMRKALETRAATR